MKNKLLLLTLVISGFAPGVVAQTQSADAATGSLKSFYAYNKRNIIGAAEKMPAEHYSFKPTSEVRSFAEILGHITTVNYMNCAPIKGEANPNKENFEKTATTKEAAIKALKASLDYCDGAFNALDEATMKGTHKMGERDIAKGSQVVLNVVHTMEHYGNLVVYLRLKGIVPPSSEPRPAPSQPKTEGKPTPPERQ